MASFWHVLQRMPNHRSGSGVIISKLGRSLADSGTVVLSDIGNSAIISRHDNLLKQLAVFCCFNGTSQHGFATKIFDVFARNAFTPSTRRDDTDLHYANA